MRSLWRANSICPSRSLLSAMHGCAMDAAIQINRLFRIQSPLFFSLYPHALSTLSKPVIKCDCGMGVGDEGWVIQ